MTIEQLKSVKVKVDGQYLFIFKDGRKVTKKGSYLLKLDPSGFKLNKRKIESIESINLI